MHLGARSLKAVGGCGYSPLPEPRDKSKWNRGMLPPSDSMIESEGGFFDLFLIPTQKKMEELL